MSEEDKGLPIDTRPRRPGTIILRVVAIRIGDTTLPEEVVANIDIGPKVVKTLLPTEEGYKFWVGSAIQGAKQLYQKLQEKEWF